MPTQRFPVAEETAAELAQIHQRLALWSEAAGLPFYATLAYAIEEAQVLSFSSWTVAPSKKSSRAPFFAVMKMQELVYMLWLRGQQDFGNLHLTPDPAFTAINLMPTNRRFLGAAEESGRIVALSKQHQRMDQLFALLTLYNWRHGQLVLHHFGKSARGPKAANAFLTSSIPVARLPGDGHRRWYQWQGDSRCERGGYHTEIQIWNDRRIRPPHLDFAAKDPIGFLQFLGNAMNVEVHDWTDDAGPNDPIGCVKIVAGRQKLTIMARKWNSRDWNPFNEIK